MHVLFVHVMETIVATCEVANPSQSRQSSPETGRKEFIDDSLDDCPF
jgi:hypothetical protein